MWLLSSEVTITSPYFVCSPRVCHLAVFTNQRSLLSEANAMLKCRFGSVLLTPAEAQNVISGQLDSFHPLPSQIVIIFEFTDYNPSGLVVFPTLAGFPQARRLPSPSGSPKMALRLNGFASQRSAIRGSGNTPGPRPVC